MATGHRFCSYQQRNNKLITWTVSWKAHQLSGRFAMATKITRSGNIRLLLLGVRQTQDLECPTSSATYNFLQGLHENSRTSLGCLFGTPSREWLTNVANVKMLVEIRSLINKFMKDFFSFEIKHI